MNLKLTPKFILTFLALTFVMHEAHEIVHTTIGRLICGCWGQRDFNVWGLCGDCSEQNPYSIITFELESKDKQTLLTLTQSNFATETMYEHSDKN